MPITNYVPYHVHTDYSTGVTNIDSVAKYTQYVKLAESYSMKSLGFSEHGNIFSWYNKKMAIEAAGMKYIHAAEVYVTQEIPIVNGEIKKVRDNYHCVLIAKNFDGFKELNALTTKAFDRNDGHFYYMPRITFDELKHTSDNIIVTTACLGGILAKPKDKAFRDEVVSFIAQNKKRAFLEVQHHVDIDQLYLNKEIESLSKRYGIPMIAGTDTHATDSFNAECRLVMQRSKGVKFDGEGNFDLTFKSCDELIDAYKKQGTLSEIGYMSAIDNTNLMADMIEPFTLDKAPKYPHIYDNPDEVFDKLVDECVENHPYLLKNHSREVVESHVAEEKRVYKSTNATMYMLLYKKLTDWCHAHDIFTGPGRGSAAGSTVCYAFRITEVDPIKYNLNFWRFISEGRVSLADIDCDYYCDDRERVFEYVLRDHMEMADLQSCQIITYQTEQMRGAIKDIGRALKMSPVETDKLAKQEVDGDVPPEVRAAYPELFKYVDNVIGVITATGRHAAGVVISDSGNDMASNMGLCSSSQTPYPITCLDMKELDALNWVKWDFLGLDYVGLINKTCKLAGIDRLTPDTVDTYDMEVWDSIRKDTTCIFQFSEPYAEKYVSKILSDKSMESSRVFDPDASMFERFALASAMLRPGAASVRDQAAEGIYQTYPIPQLNNMLKDSMGTLVLQESLMNFLVQFCGFTPSKSDYARKCVAKKRGTEQLVPEIEQSFLEYTPAHYNVPLETAKEMIDPFLQTVLESARYSFSKNHAYPYTFISYMCGWLRVHYPLEFIASAIDIFSDEPEKIAEFLGYATHNHINIEPIEYGKSRSYCTVDKEKGLVYQSLTPVKGLSESSAESIYALSKFVPDGYFSDVLFAAKSNGVSLAIIDTLIKVDFFPTFGNAHELEEIITAFLRLTKNKSIKSCDIDEYDLNERVDEFSTHVNSKGKPLKTYTITDYTAMMHIVEDNIKAKCLPDYCLKAKALDQMDILKRIDMRSGKKENRFKLLVAEVKEKRGVKNGWKWRLYDTKCVSIGTGKSAQVSVYSNLYDAQPIHENDIIELASPLDMEQSDKGYWHFVNYKVIG